MKKTINWWNNHHAQIKQTVKQGARRLAQLMSHLARNIGRLVLIGIILNVIGYFWPEFPDRFPVIYAWFNGWLQLGEFALKAGIGTIYSFFTGNFGEFWPSYTAAFQELFQQFLNWLETLRF